MIIRLFFLQSLVLSLGLHKHSFQMNEGRQGVGMKEDDSAVGFDDELGTPGQEQSLPLQGQATRAHHSLHFDINNR